MRGYGRDYGNRNWFDRAGETVRAWSGGGRDYDRDYGGWEDDRDFNRGFVGRDYDRVDWSNRGNTWNQGGQQPWRGSQGGGFGWDRGGDWNRNEWGNRDFNRGPYGGGERHLGTWTAGGR